MGQKWPKNGPKMSQKWAKNTFLTFCVHFVSFKKKKKLKTKIENFKNLDQKWPKNGPKMDLLTFSVHFVSFKKKMKKKIENFKNLGQKWAKNGPKTHFSDETTVLSFRTILLAHFSKI